MEKEPSIANIGPFIDTKQPFPYGKATAVAMEEGQFNRGARVMTRKAQEIFTGLSLPFTTPAVPQAISHDNGNAYVQMVGAGDSFFVMVRDLMNEQKLAEVASQTEPSDMSIVTGLCLFNSQSAKAMYRDGGSSSLTNPYDTVQKPVDKLVVDQDLSLYEIESVTRLSRFINIISAKNEKITSVYLNIPQVEYYLYILDAYTNGNISSNQAREWTGIVDARHNVLFEMMRRRIERNQTGALKIIDQLPLSVIHGYVMDAFHTEVVPKVGVAIQILSSSSPLWRMLIEQAKPQTWQDINNLSYIFSELYATDTSETSSHLTIAVENPTESKIFANAKAIVKSLPDRASYQIVALYPHERVIPINGQSGKILYHAKEDETQRTDNVKTVVKAYL